MPWLALLFVLWIILGAVAHDHPQSAGSLIGAGVGATVSLTVFLAGRAQGRRQTTLDLFKEYYSAEFADQRRAADRFMAKHCSVDWSRNDPYELGREDDDLAGYGAVLRYWQRVAILYEEGELSRVLTQSLLSRELGYWNARIFVPMEGRKSMYVRDMIVDLARRFEIGGRQKAYRDGFGAARRGGPPELGPHEDRPG